MDGESEIVEDKWIKIARCGHLNLIFKYFLTVKFLNNLLKYFYSRKISIFPGISTKINLRSCLFHNTKYLFAQSHFTQKKFA